MPKQKIAVRDKFYTLAKEQGYRARSAFKLLQLNRKYGLLEEATRAIDLCAAPGGWCQVLAKAMPPRAERQIIGVDLLPIKPIRGVVTFQADITTAECRRLIRHELKGHQADVVLCDGAPNVGSAFGKDAYVQAELALAALRFATDHLRRGGWFVTKVFRSADYNALIWAFQQLFRKVEATKPTSSRNVSAEIFVVCRDYIAPDKIDPKLLDPKYVFAQVAPNEADKDGKLPLSVLLGDPKKNAQRKFRQGYEDGATVLFKKLNAADFITSDDPVRVLTECNELVFSEDTERDTLVSKHPATTSEIKSLCSDIKVLGKSDFKQLLKWRMTLNKAVKEFEKANASESSEDETKADDKDDDEEEDEDEDEEVALSKALIDHEAKLKKDEKKLRKQHAKMQRFRDQGLIHPYAIDVADQDMPFSLKSLGVTNVNDPRLEEFRDGEKVPRLPKDEIEADDNADEDNKLSYSEVIEKQLEADYERYSRRKALNEPMTVQERRRALLAEKKAKKKKSALEKMTEDDFQRALEDAKLDAYKKGLYAKMLRKGIAPGNESSSEDDDEDDGSEDEMSGSDGDDEQDIDAEEKDDDDEKEARLRRLKAERWFQQSVFQDSVLEDDDKEIDPESIPLPRELLDKEKRREKRKKEQARKDRKLARKEEADRKAAGELVRKKSKTEVEVVPASSDVSRVSLDNVSDDDFDDDDARANLKKQREVDPKIKAQIEKGMGKLRKSANDSAEIEIVKRDDGNKKRIRIRTASDSESDDEENFAEAYNSDEYDSDEHATHLALGAMLAKNSTRGSVLDAAYNRYAFNDQELPAWFAEDESRHNRPNLPVTKEMIESVKARFSDLNDKPVKKVAEARMRKKKRAVQKLKEAKKKAEALVDEPDLSGRSKVRAIEKLLKGAQLKRPGSVFVVSNKSGSKRTADGKGTKGKKVKVVDPRMKKDMHRKDKGKKGGKKRKGGRR